MPRTLLLPWLLPIAALVMGVMMALAVMLTDPSLHDPVFTWTPLLAACCIVAAVALTLRAFRQLVPIIARILGSWLIAVGLLYSSAELTRVLKPSPPPVNTSQESSRVVEMERANPGAQPPESNREIPGLSLPEQPGLVRAASNDRHSLDPKQSTTRAPGKQM